MMNYRSPNIIPTTPDKLCPVSISTPYPKIDIPNKNMKCAQLLSVDMASSKGEMSGINQYLYESWTLRAEYPEIAETTKRISMVEMHHLDLLGEMITLLGGRPRLQAFKQNRHIIWNGNMLHYAEKVRQHMRYNIMLEKTAIETYSAQAKIIKEGNIAEILLHLAAEEELHLHIFEEFIKQLTC